MTAPPIPRLRAVDLNLLTVLDVLLAERNVTRAAERLGMTQPAVSNALSRLRLLFDDELFVRASKEMTPTPRALALADPIRKALDAIQTSLTQRDTFDPTADHIFRLALDDFGEALVLPRYLRWLDQTGARIRIELRREPGSTLHDALRRGHVHLVLDHVVIPGEEFQRQRVLDIELVCLVRRDHPTVKGSLTLDEYVSLEHAILEPRDNQTNLAEHYLAVVGRSRRVRVQVPHYLSMPFIISQSNLICTLPLPMARLFADNFPVRMLSCPVPVHPIPLFLMWHVSQEPDPAHRWLRRSVIERCSGI